MLKKITVYGKLRKFLGQSTFEADVNNAREAFSFLYCNFKGIEEHMKEQFYIVKIGAKTITSDLLNINTEKEIKIIPVVHGNFFTLVLGLALKYGAKKYIASKIISTVVGYVATSLILKGANDLLAPQQDTRNPVSGQDSLDPSALASNYSFTGLTNISNAGVPVNIAYGEILVGSIVVSNGVDTVQVEGTN
mgnify:CR=1 FL=1|tara:strand:+ start:1414 stop:1989 length:576 start_codon:yes stop_codon:yes gene_type:complete